MTGKTQIIRLVQATNFCQDCLVRWMRKQLKLIKKQTFQA